MKRILAFAAVYAKGGLPVLVVLGMCVSAYGDPIFLLTPSNATPQSGDTVTLQLWYNGKVDDLGLVFARFDMPLSGTGVWDLPTNPTILWTGPPSPGLTAAGSSAGVPTADCVDDVILTVNFLANPMDLTIGASEAVEIWSVAVKVQGNPGQVINASVLSEYDDVQGFCVLEGNLQGPKEFDDPAILASTTMTITATPEPATLVLVGLGGMFLARMRRRAA